jgi:hypothetical protein
MRTLTVYTADALVERWKRRAVELVTDLDRLGDDLGDYERGYKEGEAQAYRCAAAELMAILAASMEMEAAHHGDPEPVCVICHKVGHDTNEHFEDDPEADPNALLEWSQGMRP